MSAPWHSDEPPPATEIGPHGWLRALPRGAALLAVLGTGLLFSLLLRLAERPLRGAARPLTARITQAVCRLSLPIVGLHYETRGAPLEGGGMVVSNHASWLDIFALNSAQRVVFVSKAEVAGWPGIGLLAKATGTLFIKRERREAGAQVAAFRERLAAGQRLAMFPEGTSTDGRRVLPFKPTLFAALLDPALPQGLRVQPATLVYEAPEGADPRCFGWWGEMDFGPHLLRVLALPRGGRMTVVLHPAVSLDGYAGRKALAAACEAAVRQGLTSGLESAR